MKYWSMHLSISTLVKELRATLWDKPDGILFQPGYALYPFDTKLSIWTANEGLRFYEAWPGLVFDSLALGFNRSSQPL
ncbi:unnamed protein product [Brassica rapa]|uniref:Uncharacterized protein n=2 Tax=Brassica TaxID=3705 RepID=A0A8D9MBY7_BRACM|nr:unnamed protein product [Brassica napus]CAG7904210.1 unnamed protein product [Brassica rapa]